MQISWHMAHSYDKRWRFGRGFLPLEVFALVSTKQSDGFGSKAVGGTPPTAPLSTESSG